MNNIVRLLQVVTDSNLSWFPYSLGTNFPIVRETKAYWIINVSGDIQKKVMKSTFRLAGHKDSPLFAIYEPQPLPPGDNDPIPVRRRGRPATGKALSPAEKQARYRARKAQKSVTVTFNRDDVEALDMHIRALSSGHDVSIDPDKLKSILQSIRSATQSQLVSGAL